MTWGGSLFGQQAWRGIAIPAWRRIRQEARERGDERRAQYAENILLNVLDVSLDAQEVDESELTGDLPW